MGWAIPALLAALVLLGLWKLAGLARGPLLLAATGVALAFAGYAWQGRPDMPGAPAPPRIVEMPENAFAQARPELLGRFDQADAWLNLAESYQRRGDHRRAVMVIRSALDKFPANPDLWVGLGNALVLHADGRINPAAKLAFDRAAAVAPDHPGPPFFYGLALVQAGRLDEAREIWSRLLASLPEETIWREELELRLAMLDQVETMRALEGG
ncbi:MAG: tetratricopeptide repeat protein [Sphingomonadaceae bacterium]